VSAEGAFLKKADIFDNAILGSDTNKISSFVLSLFFWLISRTRQQLEYSKETLSINFSLKINIKQSGLILSTEQMPKIFLDGSPIISPFKTLATSDRVIITNS